MRDAIVWSGWETNHTVSLLLLASGKSFIIQLHSAVSETLGDSQRLSETLGASRSLSEPLGASNVKKTLINILNRKCEFKWELK